MKSTTQAAALAVFLLISVSARADAKLSAAECHGYPFVRTNAEVTHAQLMQELAELEAVGYNPGGDELYYPDDLQQAEQRLHEEFMRDCVSTPAS